jgi:tripartite-type tricarboxylate transporter receptor subunit TctC
MRLRTLFALVGLWLCATLAGGQDSKLLHIVVPFPAGGATDALARGLAPRLGAELGMNVVVENRAGASGQIGTGYVKSAPADGSVVLFTADHTIVTVPHLVANAGFDPLRDFVALGQVARFPLALSVSPASGAKSLPELLVYYKDKADGTRRNYGIPVIGGFPSTVGVALTKASGTALVAVPFQGSGQVLLNVAGDQVTAGVTGLGDAVPMHTGGRVRIVAITGARRSPALPEVPTFEELGVRGLNQVSWYAFFAPKALPAATAERFNQALAKALEDPAVRRKITDLSVEFAPTNLGESAAEFKAAAEFWTEAAKSPDFVRP